jgi:hypothetical protein
MPTLGQNSRVRFESVNTPLRYFVGRVCDLPPTPEGKRALALIRDERDPPRWKPSFIALDRLTVIP